MKLLRYIQPATPMLDAGSILLVIRLCRDIEDEISVHWTHIANEIYYGEAQRSEIRQI